MRQNMADVTTRHQDIFFPLISCVFIFEMTWCVLWYVIWYEEPTPFGSISFSCQSCLIWSSNALPLFTRLEMLILLLRFPALPICAPLSSILSPDYCVVYLSHMWHHLSFLSGKRLLWVNALSKWPCVVKSLIFWWHEFRLLSSSRI